MSYPRGGYALVALTILSCPKFKSSNSEDQATWLKLYLYIAHHDLPDGTIEGCGDWDEDTWSLGMGITRDMTKPSKLWTIKDGNLTITNYARNDYADKRQESVEYGRIGGQKSGEARRKPQQNEGGVEGGVQGSVEPKRKKEREKEGKNDNVREPSASFLSLVWGGSVPDHALPIERVLEDEPERQVWHSGGKRWCRMFGKMIEPEDVV